MRIEGAEGTSLLRIDDGRWISILGCLPQQPRGLAA
jgi:hypothetical protein